MLQRYPSTSKGPVLRGPAVNDPVFRGHIFFDLQKLSGHHFHGRLLHLKITTSTKFSLGIKVISMVHSFGFDGPYTPYTHTYVHAYRRHGTHTLTFSGAMPHASPRAQIFSWCIFFAQVVCSIDQLHCHDIRGYVGVMFAACHCTRALFKPMTVHRQIALDACRSHAIESRPMMSMAKFLTSFTKWFRWESRESHGRVTVPCPGQKRPISNHMRCLCCNGSTSLHIKKI